MRNANVVGVLGGLGNQLFQVALGFALEDVSGRRSEFDLSAFRTVPNYLAVERLGLRLRKRRGVGLLPHPSGRLPRVATALRRLEGPATFVSEQSESTGAEVLQSDRAGWYYGYWQFPEIARMALPRIRRELGLEGPPQEQRIGLHVRRGDMIPSIGETAPEVYVDAIRRARAVADLPVDVFTDDPEWSRVHLGPSGATIRTGGSAEADLLSLAESQVLICSPSTFSWWAAVLRERTPETVFAPAVFPSARDLRDRRWADL